MKDNEKFYEAFDWSTFTDANENIKAVKEFIPEDVHSIIDIGCGNGLITNELGKTYRVLGVDRSKKALEFVTTEKLESSCDHIDVADESFDMVFSSELLEHLNDEIYFGTLKEFKRISKKYILISVPFDESLSKGKIQCEKCNYIYHRNLHMRSFNEEVFKTHFPEYKVLKSRSFGLKVRKYNASLAKIKHKVSPTRSWIPTYMTKNETRATLCPNCEHQFKYPYKFNLLAFMCDCLNVAVSPKIPYWFIILLEKKQGE
ncbi:MAG: class I SAM-dependent methyltransferase [Bacteroidota bacterium]